LQKKDVIRQDREFEERRRKQLHIEARAFRQATTLWEYLAAAESARFPAASKQFASEEEWTAWLVWVKSYVASVDPIKSGIAGTCPPYPEPRQIDHVPFIYLQFDDPEEAERKHANHWALG
jgi:hypothetical protein